MKTVNFLWTALILASLFFVSCEKDNSFQSIQEESNSDKKTIIVQGKPLYAGYGYDPGEDRAFRNAIYPNAIYESTDIQPALSVEVIAIDDQKNLDQYNRSYKVSTKKKSFLGLFKKSRTTTESLETRTKINSTQIAVIARISVKTQRFLTNSTPNFIPPAKRFLEKGEYSKFLDNYGPYYVADRTVGGEVYYAYAYSYCEISNWSKHEFTEKAKSSILGIFNKQSTVNVTNEDQRLLNQSLQNTSIHSNIPGFAPRVVQSVEDANAETQRIQDYLRANPTKATTIDMELKPYETLFDAPALASYSEQKETCLKYLDGWERLHQKIHHIAISTKEAAVRQQATDALHTIQMEIAKAASCNNPTPPNYQPYEALLRETKKNQFLVPIYRYWNLSNGDHFYTTNFNELGHGGKGYKSEGITGHLFSVQLVGTVPVYRYWSSKHTDHFYTTYFNELGPGRDSYRYEGIVGYVYPNFDCDRKPLYRYWNSGNGDHFYTTNYHELGAGAFGWKYEGIMGYVVP